MGGNITLEFAARYPELLTAGVLIDSVVLPVPAFVEVGRPLAEALKGHGHVAILNQVVSSLFLPTDDPVRKADILTMIAKTPQHVPASAFSHHITEYDATNAASGCRVPLAYIASELVMADLPRFGTLCPQLITAQTLGAGHFSTLEVPDQINAMLARFMTLSCGGAPVAEPELAMKT
jgi:pimeloyl-ACP methyl ester carboxylesterase